MIYADDETTWPTSLRKLLDDRLSTLMAFEHERETLDKLVEMDRSYKHKRARNPYQDEHERTISDIDDRLSDAVVAGYHCTRLCADEIAVIRSTGLRPLSADLARERVR